MSQEENGGTRRCSHRVDRSLRSGSTEGQCRRRRSAAEPLPRRRRRRSPVVAFVGSLPRVSNKYDRTDGSWESERKVLRIRLPYLPLLSSSFKRTLRSAFESIHLLSVMRHQYSSEHLKRKLALQNPGTPGSNPTPARYSPIELRTVVSLCSQPSLAAVLQRPSCSSAS